MKVSIYSSTAFLDPIRWALETEECGDYQLECTCSRQFTQAESNPMGAPLALRPVNLPQIAETLWTSG